MSFTYPHKIENPFGERITFLEVQKEPDGDRVLVENFVTPGRGPLMHTHWLQDESLTVVKGRIGYQVQGQPAQYATEGETVLFTRGIPHRFWNDGQELLHCKGWIKPAGSVVFYLSAVYAAQNKSGNERPEKFDIAYLLKRYGTEFDLPEIPKFVKKIVIPITYYVGRILGRYKHFKNAPEPVTSRRQ